MEDVTNFMKDDLLPFDEINGDEINEIGEDDQVSSSESRTANPFVTADPYMAGYEAKAMAAIAKLIPNEARSAKAASQFNR